MIGLLLLACLSPEARFEREVAPVIGRNCGGGACHGVTPGQGWEDLPAEGWFFAVDALGRVADVEAARAATLAFVDPTEDPLSSPLLRKALPAAWGGLHHGGGDNFPAPSDPAVLALATWIAAEPVGGATSPPLSTLEERFRDEVLPVLDGLGCGLGGCHGPEAAIPFRLDPGVGGARGVAAVRASYHQAREQLALEGPPEGSRLFRKALPQHAGGILHKGGNDRFLRGPDDPRLAPMLAWACAERAVGLGLPCEAAGDGLIVTLGPPGPPEDPFAMDAFVPGTDLWALDGEALRPLTTALTLGAGDARDPALHPEGRRLAFALRLPGEAGHAIWELDLLTGEARRRTHGPGADREPAWGPDDGLWFVSTRAGELTDDGQRLDAELYELSEDDTLSRRSFTPHDERRPAWLHLGHEAGAELSFTALRGLGPGPARAHPFRFPPGLETEYHQHFGASLAETWVDDLAETPDGRYLAVVGQLGDRVGRIALIERNFGPRLAEGRESALAGYRDPVVWLTEAADYRRPLALPDGRVLAVAETAGGEARIARFRLVDDEDGPRLVGEADALHAPGQAARQVIPAGPRPTPVLRGAWAWNVDASTAILKHQGLPMIDAILRDLSPAGVRAPDPALVAARVIVALRPEPGDRAPLPADLRPEAWPAATSTGLPGFGPARVAVELALPADGSLYLQLQPGEAYRIQGLDADGLAVGAPHNRWFDVHPGQVLPQGVSPDRYRLTCAGCHGSADGRPVADLAPVDGVSGASVTLARFEGGDRRRPRPPTPLAPAPADWTQTVRPLLAGCVACHEAQPPRLTPTPTAAYDAAYEALLDGWVTPGRARESALAELILGRELDAPYALPPGAAPHGDLDDAERRAVFRWIDLGASFSEGTP